MVMPSRADRKSGLDVKTAALLSKKGGAVLNSRSFFSLFN